MVNKADCSLIAIDLLAEQFKASVMATGSRFATMVRCPCAFVLSEKGKIRYSSRSAALRDAKGWIPLRLDLPAGSVSQRRRAGDTTTGTQDVKADLWFEDWEREGQLLEDARHLEKWDQTITLLWCEDDDPPPLRANRRQREEEELGLAELDGILPWPGRSKRRP